MRNLKNYLGNKGAEFAKTTEFLQFYALPYIPRPQEHISFQTYFTIEWQQELKDKVAQFVSSLQFSRAKPRLLEIYQNFETTAAPTSFQDLRDKLSSLEAQHS